jgi:hypothetical protein
MQLDTATGAWVYEALTKARAPRDPRGAQALRASQPKISPWVLEVAAA